MKLLLVGAGLFFSVAGFAEKISTIEILSKVDEIRNPSQSYLMKVRVTDSGSDSPSLFEVSIRGNNRTYVQTLEPARDRGRNLLMLDEEMWAYIPNLKRAVRISLGQKLTGQAANGDISRMRWSGDYSAAIETESRKEWTLLLSAQKKGLTYDKIRAWIEKDSYRPTRAEFLTPAGKVLKRVTYLDYRELAGRQRPSKIEIQDSVRETDRSTLSIEQMTIKDFPDSTFNQNSLK